MDLALLTPDSSYDQFRAIYEARIATHRALFARHCVTLKAVAWTEAEPAHPTLALLAWGYHLQSEKWLDIVTRWPDAPPLFNPPATLAWNTDKSYLLDLEAAGVAIVPTRFAPLADEAAVAEARIAFGVDEVVVKPRVSASAHKTQRVPAGSATPEMSDAMIQPFMPAVLADGEQSLFFFGGRFSHGVRKVAAPGDFRVQREYGGRFTPLDPDRDLIDLARAAIAAAPATPLYARVDIVHDRDGAPRLMELELIEPDLYLDMDAGAGDRFAAVVVAALR